MLLYPPMNDLLKSVPSRYLLVNVVAHRARTLANETDAAHIPLEDKAVTLAIKEVAEGVLTMENAPV